MRFWVVADGGYLSVIPREKRPDVKVGDSIETCLGPRKIVAEMEVMIKPDFENVELGSWSWEEVFAHIGLKLDDILEEDK